MPHEVRCMVCGGQMGVIDMMAYRDTCSAPCFETYYTNPDEGNNMPTNDRDMPRIDALEEFDRFCRFIDCLNMGGFVENDFMSKKIQAAIRAKLTENTPAAQGDVAQRVLDVATDAFKAERDKWAVEKKNLERRLKAAKPHPAPVAQSQEVLSDAPCKKCGYNGVGYYQPDTHPCAATQNQPAGSAEQVTVEEFARGMVIAFAADLTPKEIAESLQKNYPHGLILTTGAKK